MDARLKTVIEHPLHKYLGVTTIESESGRGKLPLKVTENNINPVGLFHGGVIYLLCDICASGGLLSLIDDDVAAVTHDIQISILRPAKLGDFVCFNSEVVKLGKSLCFIDVKVTLENGVLTIQGERKQEKEEKDKKYHRVERYYGSFTRSFTLPDNVDEDKIEATFKDGMLNLQLTKTEAAKPKAIDVKIK